MEDQQEIFFKASLLERQSQELQQNLQLIENQISELEQFKENLDYFSKNEEKKMLSQLGKGIFVRTSLESKELLVEVGSGVVVKKTPEETIKIIESQISKLNEAKLSIQAQLESYNKDLAQIIKDIQKAKEKTEKEK